MGHWLFLMPRLCNTLALKALHGLPTASYTLTHCTQATFLSSNLRAKIVNDLPDSSQKLQTSPSLPNHSLPFCKATCISGRTSRNAVERVILAAALKAMGSWAVTCCSVKRLGSPLACCQHVFDVMALPKPTMYIASTTVMCPAQHCVSKGASVSVTTNGAAQQR